MICAYDECKKPFEPKTHNQKYCSDDCCRTATNLKLKEQYYEKKARLAGKKRVCKSYGCNVVLSRYNETSICDRCVSAKREKERQDLLRMIQNVSGKTGKA
jgi:hypothetical protein